MSQESKFASDLPSNSLMTEVGVIAWAASCARAVAGERSATVSNAPNAIVVFIRVGIIGSAPDERVAVAYPAVIPSPRGHVDSCRAEGVRGITPRARRGVDRPRARLRRIS